MSLEKQCRRSPDIEGIQVLLQGGEKWRIKPAPLSPVFEKTDGQWLFLRFDLHESFKAKFDRICSIWDQTAENDAFPSTEAVEELTKLSMELSAMGLDANYDLTPQQLGGLIDPLDQDMSMAMLKAVRGIDASDEIEDEPEETEAEKKNG